MRHPMSPTKCRKYFTDVSWHCSQKATLICRSLLSLYRPNRKMPVDMQPTVRSLKLFKMIARKNTTPLFLINNKISLSALSWLLLHIIKNQHMTTTQRYRHAISLYGQWLNYGSRHAEACPHRRIYIYIYIIIYSSLFTIDGCNEIQ